MYPKDRNTDPVKSTSPKPEVKPRMVKSNGVQYETTQRDREKAKGQPYAGLQPNQADGKLLGYVHM